MARFQDVARRIRRNHRVGVPPRTRSDSRFGSPWDWLHSSEISALTGAPQGSPYAWHAWVGRCVEIRATAFASLPRALYTGDPEEPERVSEGPWVEVFRRPMPRMRGAEFFAGTWTYIDLLGECFWRPLGLGGAAAKGTVPMAIELLPGREYVEPVRASPTSPITAWKFRRRNGESFTVADEDLVQFRRFNPDDPDRGLSRLDAALLGVESDLYASRWNRGFFKRGATPSLAIVAPKDGQILPPDEIDRQKREFQDEHGGADKAWKPLFLQGGVTPVPFMPSHTDMGFLEQRKWSREEIAGIYGVPVWFLGATQDLKYATARESWRVLYESTILPEARAFADVLESDLFARYTDAKERARAASKGRKALWMGYDLSTVEALRDSAQERIDRMGKLLAAGYTLNEVNAYLELGLPEIPAEKGGDARLVSFSQAPLEVVASTQPDMGLDGVAPEGQAAPAGAPAVDAVQDTALNGAQIASLLEIALAVANGDLPPETAKATILASFPTLSPDEVDAIVDPAAKQAAEKPKEAPPPPPPPAANGKAPKEGEVPPALASANGKAASAHGRLPRLS